MSVLIVFVMVNCSDPLTYLPSPLQSQELLVAQLSKSGYLEETKNLITICFLP